MKIIKILIFFLVLVIGASISYSFQANSSNYKNIGTVSSGGDIINSSTYKSYVTTGGISGVINSSSYKNLLGFFYIWLLANDQPCTAANQCEGGNCCSNLCKSSTCPTTTTATTATTTTTTGGGGGAPGGGGGGAGLISTEKKFSLSLSSLKINVALAESAGRTLIIKNTGNEELTISLTVEGVENYLSLSDTVLILEPGEETEVTLSFIGKNVGSFTGQIIAKADGTEISIPIIFEVISKIVLFDVQLDIPADYSEVEPGDELKVQITMLNVGAPEKVDVLVTYFIKDFSGNIIFEETETVSVEEQISYSKSFKIDKDLEPGSYVAIVEVVYANSFAVSSQIFKVVEEKVLVATEIITRNTTLILFLATIVVGVVFLLLSKLISIKKRGKKKR